MRQRILAVFIIWSFALFVGGCATLLVPKVSAAPESLREGEYKLDPDHATLLFKVRHFGLSDYVGRFNDFEAVLDFDSDNPEMARLEAVIEVGSLDVNNKSFQKKLTSPAWFGAEQFPQAKFVSNDIKITGQNTGVASGNLTLRGITKPITMDIIFNGGADVLVSGKYTIGFEAHTSFLRSEFEIKKFKGFVSDKVKLEFYGEFQKQAD